MEYKPLRWKNKKTVVLLGAGATRGASFTGPHDHLPPPLDSDFFRVLQLSETGRTRAGKDLLAHVRAEYGPSLEVSMEAVFTNIQQRDYLLMNAKTGRGPTDGSAGRLLDAVRKVIPGILKETVGDQRCQYHDEFLGQLTAGTKDVVVSLNYDLLADRALARNTAFRPSSGGFGKREWVKVAEPVPPEWFTPTRKDTKYSVQLLKLHGSLNWRGPATPLALRSGGHSYRTVREGAIIPPVATKQFKTSTAYPGIWKSARDAVGKAKRLVVVGYSLPATDGMVRSLLTRDLSPTIEEVAIVDPDRGTRARYAEQMDRLTNGAVRIFTFRNWQHLLGS